MEGRRSILVEIQALVSPTNQAQPRRSIRGLDPTRVNQVLAVLDRHSSLVLHTRRSTSPWWEVGASTGRLRPSHRARRGIVVFDRPLGRLAAWGEIGLAGEVRSIPMEIRRTEELDRMGLEHRVAPLGGKPLRLGRLSPTPAYRTSPG